MSIKGIDLYQIFNGNVFDGLIIYNKTFIIIALAVLVVGVALAFFFNFKGAKIANRRYDVKTKKMNHNIKLTKQEEADIKKFDILKVVSLSVGVLAVLVSIYTSTTQLTSADKVKDTEAFKKHFAPVYETMKNVDGKIAKTGDTYVLTQTISGEVKGKEFVSEDGKVKIQTSSIQNFKPSIKEVTMKSNLKSDTEVTVKKHIVLGGTDVKVAVK